MSECARFASLLTADAEFIIKIKTPNAIKKYERKVKDKRPYELEKIP